MNTVAPWKNTKSAVHCAPAVNIWTPGCTVAVAAGAHAGAAGAGLGTDATNPTVSGTAASRDLTWTRRMRFSWPDPVLTGRTTQEAAQQTCERPPASAT